MNQPCPWCEKVHCDHPMTKKEMGNLALAAVTAPIWLTGAAVLIVIGMAIVPVASSAVWVLGKVSRK